MKKLLAFILAFAMTNILQFSSFSANLYDANNSSDAVLNLNDLYADDSAAQSGRTVTNINGDWYFKFGADTESAISASTDTSSWSAVSIPHTWNANDGADGGYNYKRGCGWYRKNVNIPEDFANKQIFIEFEGANTVSTLYIDGTLVPYTFEDTTRNTHNSGYAAFRYDITDYVTPGQTHLFSVCVDNTKSQQISPLDGDWTFYGGIYRDVMLISTPKVHIDVLDYASDGVYMTALPVNSANLDGDWKFTVKTTLVNETDTDAVASVKTTLREPENVEWISDVPSELTPFDESTMTGDEIFCTATEQVTVPANGKLVYTKEYTVNNPRLWNGKADPYRYQADVEVLDGENVLDKETDYIGFRHFYADKETGFYLNGQSYNLRGVSRHQDFDGIGYAINQTHHNTDFGMIYDIGANAIRLAHYPHDDYFYDLCDKYGLVVWAEVPFISLIGGTGEYGAFDEDRTAYVDNVKEQLKEMIRQQYNRPAIMFWGLQNEVDRPYESVMIPLMEDLYALAKSEDPNRLTTHATFHEQGLTWKSDLVALNFYPGWYGYEAYHFGAIHELWVQPFDKDGTMPPLGNSEFGAGGSIYQHVEDPENNRPDPFGDPVHPEEYQTFIHETGARAQVEGLRDFKKLDFLWSSFIWNMFDFGSDKRNEGDRNGVNDKGLVTFDRQVKKDSYYVYKAIWSDNPFVHIQRSRFTVRDSEAILVKVSSNCKTVSLNANGTDLGTMTDTGCGQFEMTNVHLNMGDNTVTVTATDADGNTYTESVTWTRAESNNTLISSTALTVDNDKKTVVIRTAFTASQINNLVSSDKNATFTVLDSRKEQEVAADTNVLPGMYLRVTAEDGVTVQDYIFIENNIAFGKSVKVGNTEYAALVDGDSKTSVSLGNSANPVEISIDLGNSYHLSNILVTGEAGSYEVSTSTNGINYTSSTSANVDANAVLKNTEARYLRITLTGSSVPASLNEIEVYGWRFAPTDYTVNQSSRTIITNTAGTTVDTQAFIDSLGIQGNMTYSLSSGQYFISDGDILTVVDNNNDITEYTVCTGNSCAVKHNFNIVLGKNIISTASYQTDFPMQYAIDGKIETRWQANVDGQDEAGDYIASYPQMLTIDLGGEYLVDSVDLTMFAYEYPGNRAYYYEVLTSLDNIEYEQIINNKNNSDKNGVYSHTLENATLARYITLNITGCSAFPSNKSATAGVYEFKVNGRVFDGTPEGMILAYDKMILAPGKSERVSLKLVPDYAKLPSDIVFESANTDVVTVSTDGVVTGVAAGETTVSAASASLGFSATLNVTVGDKKVLSLNRPIVSYSGTPQPNLVPKNVNDGKTWDNATGLDSRWQVSEGTYPQYVVIDLERQCSIENIDLVFFAAKNGDRICMYELYASDDNVDYTLITDNKNNSNYNGRYNHSYTDVTARYIKLNITGQSKGTAGVYEITVYGDEVNPEPSKLSFAAENITLLKGQSISNAVEVSPANANLANYNFVSENPAVVSFANGVLTAIGVGETQVYITNVLENVVDSATVTVEDMYLLSLGKPIVDYSVIGVDEGGTGFKNYVDKLTDGNYPTGSDYNVERWHIDNTHDIHYAVVDLEGVFDIKQIDLHMFYHNSRAHGYRISTSLDGVNFTTLCDKLGNTKTGIIYETVEDTKARFIKLEIKKKPNVGGSDSSTAGVYEMSVWGLPVGDTAEAAEFTQNEYTLSVGEKALNSFVTTPGNANTSTLTLVSSNPEVATLSRAGTITALSQGTTTISVVASSGITLCSATVNVGEMQMISLNKPVTAYSTPYQSGRDPSYITDGVWPADQWDNTGERWQAQNATQDGGANHYLTVDLQGVYNISKIDLYFFYRAARTCGYKLYSSLDGEQFNAICDKLSNTTLGDHSESFTNVTARFIKVEITKPTSGSSPGLYEMAIYGTAVSDENNPTTCLDDISIRVREPSGLRFMAYVNNDQDSRVNTAGDEFGFIVTRKALLDASGLTEANFTHHNAKDKKLNIVEGKSKFYDVNKNEFKEIIFDNDMANSRKYFTGVLTGIPADYYKDVLVARPYLLIDDEYFYGNAVSSDIYSIAEAIYNDRENNPPTEEIMAYIKTILGIQ